MTLKLLTFKARIWVRSATENACTGSPIVNFAAFQVIPVILAIPAILVIQTMPDILLCRPVPRMLLFAKAHDPFLIATDPCKPCAN